METSKIVKKYGMFTIIEKTDKRYFTNTVYKCCCDCGNVCKSQVEGRWIYEIMIEA